jgi:hypothetical protein
MEATMVKTMRQVTFLIVLAGSLIAAQIAFAGPDGFAGDSVSVVRTTANTNLVITQPVIGQNEILPGYRLVGGPGDTVICGDFGGNGVDGVGVVRDATVAGSLLWIGNWSARLVTSGSPLGSESEDYIVFGNQISDTPLMMDVDPTNPGDELVVVRQDETNGELLWIWRTPSNPATSSRNFGPNSGIPAPGNYDTDLSNGDEFGATYDVPAGKAWLLEGEGAGNENILFGAITDQKYQYTWNGITVPGVTRKSGTTNRVFINDTALTGALSSTTATVGNATDTVLANCDIHYSNCAGSDCAVSN